MSKLKIEKLVSFGLNIGSYGVATESEIAKICKELKTTVYKKEIATYDDCEWEVCCGGEIDENVYIIEGGLLEVTGECEEYELNFIPITLPKVA